MAQKVLSGKVRDVYELDDGNLAVVTSDRISAFDVVMNETVRDRGRVLTALSDFWLSHELKDLPNHLVATAVPDAVASLPDVEGRCQVVRRAEMVPVEFIVRARLAGSGWKEYVQSGTLHGAPLPEGLLCGSALSEPQLTPSTKAELGEHDVNLSLEEACDVAGREVMEAGAALVLQAFAIASKRASEAGFILADSKFELGWIDGTLSLCDEVLTPDSSRLWPKEGWQLGDVPPPFDKQILRNWLDEQPWDKTPPPPTVPDAILDETRSRYITAYEALTGRVFADWPGV